MHRSCNTGISYFLDVFSSLSTIPYNREEILLYLILILPASKEKKGGNSSRKRICHSKS